MLQSLVILIAVSICVIDLKSHRIPNRLSFILAVLLILDAHRSLIVESLPTVAITFVIGYFGKVGAGDVKLFLTLLLTSTSIVLNAQYFLGMAFVSGGLIALTLLTRGVRGKMIPFAPALLLPFLDIYLAI